MSHKYVAIIGSGPSGIYAAIELLKADSNVMVDMFDRLPVMGGLARFGVSPDHAIRRNVVQHYEYQLVSSNRFSFYGNIEIGQQLQHQDLIDHYHAVIYACGCSQDKKLGIAGETLPGCYSATDFVNWYNGHPDHRDHQFDFSGSHAVVIGNGNVALDVARMLLLDTSALHKTDMAQHAVDALSKSNITEVTILGRRGPAQASFTTPELMELEHLQDIAVSINAGQAVSQSLSAISKSLSATSKSLNVTSHSLDEASQNFSDSQKLALFQRYHSASDATRKKKLTFTFFHSPEAVLGSHKVNGLSIRKNEMVITPDGSTKLQPTDTLSELKADMVFRAIGYQGLTIPGLPTNPHNQTLPHHEGRVIDTATHQAVNNTYVVGWQKRGPSGVIGTNKLCAQETVNHVLTDISTTPHTITPLMHSDFINSLLNSIPAATNYRDWKTIDREEQQQGNANGRPRLKAASYPALEQILQGSRVNT
jgi:ferredoxin--NADP+ reductase